MGSQKAWWWRPRRVLLKIRDLQNAETWKRQSMCKSMTANWSTWIRPKSMYKKNKNDRPGNSLIFILPACSFVVALNLEWLDDVNPETFAQKTKFVKTNSLDIGKN